MRNSSDRANLFTNHASNITGCLHGDRIEIADKSSILRANGYAHAAFDASIPGDGKNNGQGFHSAYIFLKGEFGLKYSAIVLKSASSRCSMFFILKICALIS